MKKDIIIMFAGLICRFERFGSESFWDNWQWQLDSFRIKENSLKDGVLIETRKGGEGDYGEESGLLVAKEQMGFFKWEIFRLPDNATKWCCTRSSSGQRLLCLEVSEDWKVITLLEDRTESAGNAAFSCLSIIIPGICLNYNLLTLHAALLEQEGSAIAICAASGTGKTTHARLWRDHKNAIILNGDRAVCGCSDGIWYAYGTPWSGSSGEQINRSAKLEAIVVLERAYENKVYKIAPEKTFALVAPHIIYPFWDREMVECAMKLSDDMLRNVPVYRLCCRPDEEAVDVLYKVIKESRNGDRKKMDII